MGDEVDLRSFPYIPLHIGRLQRSKAWLICKREPALAFYMVNLWMRAWHEVPAGSIEDDDDVLSDAAMCPLNVWKKVREKVLRGWEARDGRVYNTTVAEVGQTTWAAKQGQIQRTSAARQARLQSREQQTTEPVASSVTDNDTEDVTASNITKLNLTEPNRTKLNLEGRGVGKPFALEAPALPDAGKPAPKPPKRAMALPDNFSPNEEGFDLADRLLGDRVAAEFDKFRDHHLKTGKVYKDWDAAWRGWVRRADEFHQQRKLS